MTSLIFVGGIVPENGTKWLDDGKSFSRNFKQGNRVYDSAGLATALSAQAVGGLGGPTSLYLTKRIGGDLPMTNYIDVLTKSAQQYDFTFVECFAGIGGVSFGFESVGGKCVLAAEYDPTAEGKRQFAQDAYKTLHPGTPVVGDVFKLDAADVPDHDVLSFTTPCQSFSVAGKRLGFEDTRGTLVFEALRIANAKRPKALFMENVKGLVNHDKGRTIDTILHAMNEIGYTVDFNVLNSKYFGVPQNRERVFIIALRDDLVEPSEWQPEGNTMLPKAKRRLKEAGLRTFDFDWPSQNSVDCRLRDVLEVEVDPKYYLAEDKTAKLVAELESKDLVIGSVASHPFSKKFEFNGFNNADYTPAMIATDYKAPKCLLEAGLPIREATTQGYAIAREGDAVNIAFPSSKTRRGRVGEQMANTLEASGCNQGVVDPQYRIRKLTPRECMRLQGFPESATDLLYAEGFSDSRIYKFAGNAVTTTVIKALAERLAPQINAKGAI